MCVNTIPESVAGVLLAALKNHGMAAHLPLQHPRKDIGAEAGVSAGVSVAT